jgi:hypothetical protein
MLIHMDPALPCGCRQRQTMKIDQTLLVEFLSDVATGQGKGDRQFLLATPVEHPVF